VLLPRFVTAAVSAGRLAWATLGSASQTTLVPVRTARTRRFRPPSVSIASRLGGERERERERESAMRNYRCNAPVFRHARDAYDVARNDASNARNVAPNYVVAIRPSSYFDIPFDGSRLRRLTRACSRFAITNLILLPASARAWHARTE